MRWMALCALWASATALAAAEGGSDTRFGMWIEPAVLQSSGGAHELKLFLSSTADRVQGWSFGIRAIDGAAPGAAVRIVDASAGADLNTSGPNHGAPAFVNCGLLPAMVEWGTRCPECTELTMGVVLDFVQQTFINATTRFEALRVQIEVGGDEGDAARIEFAEDVGDPHVRPLIVVGGESLVPARQDGVRIQKLDCIQSFFPRVADATGASGTDQSVRVYVDFDHAGNAAFRVQGWSLGVRHDPAMVELLDATTDGTDTIRAKNGAEPDFNEFRFVPSDPPNATEGFTHGVVLDFMAVLTLSPRNGFLDCVAKYRLVGQPACPEPLVTELVPAGDLGDPVVRLVMVVGGESLEPCEVGRGRLQIVCGVPFVRGDSNGDRRMDIADGVFIFQYLFRGGAAPSPFDAADVNDDGVVDSSDGIYVINYQFRDGPPPPPPFPESGIDVTEDGI